MTDLPFVVERAVLICATRETVFRYFTDSDRFAKWWGAGSSIDPRPGGKVRIRYPNGAEAEGEILTIDPPRAVAMTYGYPGEGAPIPIGGSRVEITLEEEGDGTRVHLRHAVRTEAIGEAHRAGWSYQLAVFAAVASAEAQSRAEQVVDEWFAGWSREGDAGRAHFERCAIPEVRFADRYGWVVGLEELMAHIEAARRHIGSATIERVGPVRMVHGTGVVEWSIPGPDDRPTMRGTNVVDFAPDGRLRRVIGLQG